MTFVMMGLRKELRVGYQERESLLLLKFELEK